MGSDFKMACIRDLSSNRDDTERVSAALLSLASGLAWHIGSFPALQWARRHMHDVFQ